MKFLMFMAPMVFSLALLAQDTESSWKTYQVPADEAKIMVISGFKGKVKLTASTAAKEFTIRLRYNSKTSVSRHWKYSVRQDGSKLTIQVPGPDDKRALEKIDLEAVPELEIEVSGPPVPTALYWRQADIQAKDWHAALQIVDQKGKVTVSGGEGGLRISLTEGEALVVNRKGNLDIDSYQGRVNLSKVNGEAKINNFIGRIFINESDGIFDLTSFKGPVKITNSKGQLAFNSRRGPVSVDKFDGSIRGNSGQGPVKVKITGEADIRIKTNQAPVTIRGAGGSRVNVGTADGDLYVPETLKTNRYPNLKVATGLLPGGKGGRVFVRTESGRIQVR